MFRYSLGAAVAVASLSLFATDPAWADPTVYKVNIRGEPEKSAYFSCNTRAPKKVSADWFNQNCTRVGDDEPVISDVVLVTIDPG